jgi:hypothetical protein
MALVAFALATPGGAAVLDILNPGKPQVAQSLAGTITSLTDAQLRTANSIVSSDPLISRILSGVQPSSTRVDSWTHLKDNGLIGAVVRISLPTPVSFDDVVPTISYDATEATLPYYHSDLLRWSVKNATQLVVSVDLARNQVVGIHFDPGADATALDPLPAVERGDQ